MTKRSKTGGDLTPEIVSKVMREMGRKGGKVSNPNKGFGTTARDAGAKGLEARWEKWRQEHPKEAAASEARRKKRAGATKKKAKKN